MINQRKLLPQNGQQPGLGVLCALRKHPLCPQPSHAAFKLRKITCSSKLGRTGRKHGAHRSPGADQDQFPVNPQGYKGDFQSTEQGSLSPAPDRRRGPNSPSTRRHEQERGRRWDCAALKKRGGLLETSRPGLATKGQGQSCWRSPAPGTSLPNAAHTPSPKRPERCSRFLCPASASSKQSTSAHTSLFFFSPGRKRTS